MIPEASLQKEDVLIGVFAANKTGVIIKSGGGAPSGKEYVIYADEEGAKAFADDLVTRFAEYRTLCLYGVEKVDRQDFKIAIDEIPDSPSAFDNVLKGIMGRTCKAFNIPFPFSPSASEMN